MKQRSREINIFNMSLLDILCGALGTFCFMMIVLFPYYSAKPTTAPDIPKDWVDPKTLADAKEQIQKLKENIEKLQNYTMGLEKNIDQNKQQISQLQQELDQLKKKEKQNQDYGQRLSWRNPFLAFARFFEYAEGDQYEIWWDTDVRVPTDQTLTPKYKLNPNDYQKNFFAGDLV